MQGSHSGRRSAVRSGLLTGLSAVAISASAAIAGAILSRKFGHGAETDGFFAAYAVYVAVVLVASALRVVVLPVLARARAADEDDGGGEGANIFLEVADEFCSHGPSARDPETCTQDCFEHCLPAC